MSEATIVQALYNFKGTNNDELWFKKGDKITVTQKEEGGWWEGTLGDKTGWFPANFVKEIKEVTTPVSPVSQQRQYRAVVLKDLIDSEKAHVTELQGLVKTFLKPLEKATILSADEYRQLTGNINEVLETHQQLLELLEECETKPSNEQRVGKIFLTWAPKIKQVHQAYCSMHPRAVCILDLYKDELATYMESCGAATPGLLVLTTGLSKPFRRLDKYSGMLQELERHVEINHPDRGDTQRSVAVYKEIAATCAATRRQKELELQVLTGPVRGWEGQSLAQLGDILHMGSVAVGPQHQDRYLVLFPNTLLVLSVSHRMSAFIYEGKLPLTGITVIKLEENENFKNAFEISGPMIEKIVAICQSKEEANNWVELLRQHTKGHHKTPPPNEIVPTPPPHLDRRGYSVRSSIFNYSYKPPISFKATLPPWFYPPASPYSTLTKSFYRLVKEKVITHRLLKHMLYPEYLYLNNVDLSQVVRRKHKTECYIQTGTYKEHKSNNERSSDSDSSDEDSDDDNKLHRQNAIFRNSSSESVSNNSNISGSTASNPFGFIRYFNPQTEGPCEDNYESFIDYGENIEQPKIAETVQEQELAKTKLVTPQISEDSQGSSFDYVPRPFMACEDLVNIDEATEIESTLGLNQFVMKTRHSLPTKFVANKFNKSSLTMVYIPQWQSNSESNLTKRVTREEKTVSRTEKTVSRTDSESSGDTTTHSSCLDVPVNPFPVPDNIVAELLYNSTEHLIHSESVESDQTEMSSKTVIKPPSMFKNISGQMSPLTIKTQSIRKSQNEDISVDPNLNLRFSNVRKHSINSDKPKRQSSVPKEFEEQLKPSTSKDKSIKRRSSIQENQPLNLRKDKKTNSLRKCVSYHYLTLNNAHPNYNYPHFCRCCTEPCYSRRSSDSGMAGSCTLNSPDLATANEVTGHIMFPNRDHYSLTDIPNMYDNLETDNRDVISLSEIEARDFEAQCRCTSPFGSTPRTSCQASTSENIGILVGARDSTTSVTSTSSDMSPYPTPHPWESENQIYEKVMSMKEEQKPKLIHKQQQWNPPTEKSKSCENFSFEEEKQTQEIFRSGLYAHWWMKAKLPKEMIQGIVEESTAAATTPTNRPNGNLPNNRIASTNLSLNNNGGWSANCLRPSPPLRPCLALGSIHGSPARSTYRKTTSHNDDAQILKVIEAYCTSTRPKNTISTDKLSESNKSTIDNSGKSLGDIVKSLQEEVRDLHRSIGVLLVQLTEERLARSSLQNIVRTFMVTNSNSKDCENIHWPSCEQ